MTRWITLGARLLLGLVFFGGGVMWFVTSPQFPPMAEAPGKFLEGLLATKYMMTLVKATEAVGGAMLLANFYAPAAVLILTPIVVNIFLFHAILMHDGLPVAIAVTVFWGWLLYAWRDIYCRLCVRKPA